MKLVNYKEHLSSPKLPLTDSSEAKPDQKWYQKTSTFKKAFQTKVKFWPRLLVPSSLS